MPREGVWARLGGIVLLEVICFGADLVLQQGWVWVLYLLPLLLVSHTEIRAIYAGVVLATIFSVAAPILTTSAHDLENRLASLLPLWALSLLSVSRLRSETALHAEVLRYRRQASMLDQVHDAVVTTDNQGHIRYMNQAAYQRYEIDPREAVLGSTLGEFFHFEWQGPAQMEEYKRDLEALGVWKGKKIHVTHRGNRFWGESVISLMREEGGTPTGITAVVRDVTERVQAEAALEESREHLRLANEAAGIGTWSLEPGGDHLGCDATTRRQLGFAPEERVSLEAIAARTHPEDLPALERGLEAFNAGEPILGLEIRLAHPGGSTHHIRAVGRSMLDREGRLYKVIGTSVDITEQRVNEQALKDYASGLSFLSSTALQMLQPLELPELFHLLARRVYDLADGSIVLVNEFRPETNQTILRELCCTDEERETAQHLFGRDLLGMVFDFPETTRERMRRGEVVLVKGGLCDLAFNQFPQEFCDAVERALNLGDIYTMPCSTEQDLLGMVIVLTRGRGPLRNKPLIDSTVNQAALALRQKRTEQQLRDERNFVEAVFEIEGAVVAILASDCTILRLNRTYFDVTGRTTEEMVGRPFWEITGSTDATETRRRLEALSGPQQAVEYESVVALKSGASRHVRWRITALRNGHGALANLVATGIDITDRIEAEERIGRLNDELKQRAHALEQANRTLEHLSLEDPLTGIANRRYLSRFVEREWSVERRHQHRVSLLMVDIDYFKAFNDLYGHVHGDECLRKVARTLVEQVGRPTDVVARVGGEEFAVFLPDTEEKGAVTLAERMRRSVAELKVPHAGSDVAPVVTISVGAATVNARSAEFETLMEAADEALYRAKSDGRNRVALRVLQ